MGDNIRALELIQWAVGMAETFGSDIPVMLSLLHSSRQIVVADKGV
jgi:hypothetical protein